MAAGSMEDKRSRGSSGTASSSRRIVARAKAPPEVGTVGGNIDAGQHDFLVSAGHRGADLFGDGADRDRTIGTAPEWDDAESAPMVATLLDLHEGSSSASERGDQVRGGLARGHDVG